MLTASAQVPGMTTQSLLHLSSNLKNHALPPSTPTPVQSPSMASCTCAWRLSHAKPSHTPAHVPELRNHTDKRHAQPSFSSQMGELGAHRENTSGGTSKVRIPAANWRGVMSSTKTALKDTPWGPGPGSVPPDSQVAAATPGRVRVGMRPLLPCAVLNTCIGVNPQPGWEGPPHAPTSLFVLAVSASWDAFPYPHRLLLFPSQVRLYLLGILRTPLVSHTGPGIEF